MSSDDNLEENSKTEVKVDYTFMLLNSVDNALIQEKRDNNSRAIEYWIKAIQVINEYNEQDKDIFIGKFTIQEVQSRVKALMEKEC